MRSDRTDWIAREPEEWQNHMIQCPKGGFSARWQLARCDRWLKPKPRL